jgi:hypothetical protein
VEIAAVAAAVHTALAAHGTAVPTTQPGNWKARAREEGLG